MRGLRENIVLLLREPGIRSSHFFHSTRLLTGILILVKAVTPTMAKQLWMADTHFSVRYLRTSTWAIVHYVYT